MGDTTRHLIAIGDLHGDYFRLQRILTEQGALTPQSAWNPEARAVDVVFIGDLVDWRGEPMEGPEEEHRAGARRVLEQVRSLLDQVEVLRAQDPTFTSRVFPILGNHDHMMVAAADLFQWCNDEEIFDLAHGPIDMAADPPSGTPLLGDRTLAADPPSGTPLLGDRTLAADPPSGTPHSRDRTLAVVRQLVKKKAGHPSQAAALTETVLGFFNWYTQGGEMTIESFGGLAAWREAMDQWVRAFITDRFHLGVVLNHRLFLHTVPDFPDLWRPLEELVALEGEAWIRARDACLWGRRIWGYDIYGGGMVEPLSPDQVEAMLAGFGVGSVVVGHTPLHQPDPVPAYGGRVINIDSHGVPGSRPFVETYDPAPAGVPSGG